MNIPLAAPPAGKDRLSWGTITLTVTDLPRAQRFWSEVLGLLPRPHTGAGLALGTAAQTLVVLQPGATKAAPRGVAGLFHVAFSLPRQAEFSRMIRRLMHKRIAFSPVDHLMSKALYLDDPDGHGIEITLETPQRFGGYASQPGRFAMLDTAGRPHSGRAALDIGGELVQADGTEPMLPLPVDAGISHLHLHVPALDAAVAWFQGVGFIPNLALPNIGMADMGAGGPFRHRLAVNIWAGLGVASAPAAAARLVAYQINTADAALFAAAQSRLKITPETGHATGIDPAGVQLTMALQNAGTTQQMA
jgi:catechol 2,3-dioxygenase